MILGLFYLQMNRSFVKSNISYKYPYERHSHVSLLINIGFSVLAIGERVGHEAEKITYRYAHLFPTVQTEMAEKLEMERMEKEDSNGKKS